MPHVTATIVVVGGGDEVLFERLRSEQVNVRLTRVFGRPLSCCKFITKYYSKSYTQIKKDNNIIFCIVEIQAMYRI